MVVGWGLSQFFRVTSRIYSIAVGFRVSVMYSFGQIYTEFYKAHAQSDAKLLHIALLTNTALPLPHCQVQPRH